MMKEAMTIDELARRSGVTTRNIRAYQTKGLLPPPRMRGRVGYYDEGHFARLRYIERLQSRGFSLAAIHDLVVAWEDGRSLTDVLGFEGALTAPWSEEEPRIFTAQQIAQMFPETAADPSLLDRALELGTIHRSGDDYEAPSPTLIEVGAELVALGVPLGVVLDEYESLRADAGEISKRFVKLFENNVWNPYVQAGMPPERLEDVTAALVRMRPAASRAMHAALMLAMEEAVAAATAEQVRLMIEGTGESAAN